MQVGVWIPKAKMGPEAENFRPLGMPNTLDLGSVGRWKRTCSRDEKDGPPDAPVPSSHVLL